MKKIIIYLIMVTFMINIVNAITLDNVTISHYYRLENKTDEGNYPLNITDMGITTFVNGKLALGSKHSAGNNFKVLNVTNVSKIKTIEFWFNTSSVSTYQGMFGLRGVITDNDALSCILRDTGFLQCDTSNNAVLHYCRTTTKVPKNEMIHVVYRIGNGSNDDLWLNGVLNQTCNGNTSLREMPPTNYNLTIGESTGGLELLGIMDNLIISENRYTVADIADAWNDSYGRQLYHYQAPLKAPNNITLINPLNNSLAVDYYTTFTYNFSADNTASASLFINGILNETKTSQSFNTKNYFYKQFNNEGFYNWSINITNTAGTATSTTNYFTVDENPYEINGTLLLRPGNALIVRQCRI